MRNALEMYRNTKYNINTISAYKRVYNKRQQSFLQTFAYTTKRQYTNFLSSLALDISSIVYLCQTFVCHVTNNVRQCPSQNRIRKLYYCLF